MVEPSKHDVGRLVQDSGVTPSNFDNEARNFEIPRARKKVPERDSCAWGHSTILPG